MAKVAICMATYNVGDYLKDMLDSLVNQTFKDFTVYIWMDGCDDNTLEVIESFTNKLDIRYKDFRPIHNIGTVKNKVVKWALTDKPEYIQMVDSDDLLEPTMLEDMVREIDESGADFVICDGVMFGEQSGVIKNDLNNEIGQEMASALIERENPFFSWAMFRADVLKEQNFDIGLKHFEDWSLYIRLLKAKRKFSILRKPLYNYRMHSGQFHKVTDKNFDKHKRYMWEMNNIIKD